LRKNFFKIYRQYGYAPTESFASPDVGHTWMTTLLPMSAQMVQKEKETSVYFLSFHSSCARYKKWNLYVQTTTFYNRKHNHAYV